MILKNEEKLLENLEPISYKDIEKEIIIIEKINIIFEKIFNEFGDKMKSKKYISKSSLQKFLDNSETPKMSREKIEEGAFFVIQRPFCYLELIDDKDENNNYENNNWLWKCYWNWYYSIIIICIY